MANRPAINILSELGRVLPGDALEAIADELADPGANLGLGQRARFAAACIALGNQITEQVKAELMGVGHHIDADVVFKWRNPSTQIRVKTKAIQAAFSQDERPEFYQSIEVKGGVVIDLPFEAK